MYPGRNFPPRRQNRRENVNESIRVREVRAVFPDGTTEVMPTAAALRKAQELGLDLVLIAPTAVPPVAKAVDFGHYQYDQKKKAHDAKKKQHVVQVKELKFRPNTDDHDYDFKKKNAIRFLQEGNRVKAVVQFRGREIAHADLGKKLLMRLGGDLAAYGAVESQPRLEGRNAHILISPVKGGGKSEKGDKTFLHRGISARNFKRQFTLADHVEVKGARFENGLLVVDLQREIPEAMKPRRLEINGAAPSNVTQIEAKAA